jgi:F0F1-type ATP synthase assembly protein I
MFVVSAVLFGLSGLRARDWFAVAGAGAFLIANIIFMFALSRDDTSNNP